MIGTRLTIVAPQEFDEVIETRDIELRCLLAGGHDGAHVTVLPDEAGADAGKRYMFQ